MNSHQYYLLDVFTDKKFGGNPLAVFPDASRIPEQYFQKIAKELNLSETTFVLPPDDGVSDFKVRIFTPQQELPMAGHPTIGTAYILLKQGLFKDTGKGSLVLQEGIGPVQVEFEMNGSEPGMISMTQNAAVAKKIITDRSSIARMLSLDEDDLYEGALPQVFSSGVDFLYVALNSLQAVQKASVQTEHYNKVCKEAGALGIFVFSLETVTSEASVHSRMFAPAAGIPEDPATGSAQGPLTAYLLKNNLITFSKETQLISEQGFEMGRPSKVFLRVNLNKNEIESVRVGGHSVLVGRGEIFF